MATYVFHKLSDLKKRANRLAREENRQRHDALDETARRGGYQNYAHARVWLPDLQSSPFHRIEIYQRWRDTKARLAGTASVTVKLRTPLLELIKLHQLEGYLGGCTLPHATRVDVDGFMRDKSASRQDVMRVARALQFMDATRLKPSGSQRRYPKGKWDNRPELADHDHGWYDPEARVHLLMSEPYRGDSAESPAHLAWEQRHGWRTIKVERTSIYGLGTELFLMGPEHYLPTLAAKVARLMRSPDPLAPEAVETTEHPLPRGF
ncbi:hypothetical protein FHS96_005549 [Sphingomonas zeicaulis]|uniref:hypothetical protein n=1 Tax=Sphingomonas zeicaulis TaxID=1632740 RepID=UPI003D1907A1